MGETAQQPRLIVVSERDHRIIDLATECGVGRAPENTIVVKDDMVSRKHCVIEKTSTGYRVRDLKSFNGTYLNSERIQDEPLKPWDSVRVGRTRIFFVELSSGALPPDSQAPAQTPEAAAAPGAPEAGEATMGMTKQMSLPTEGKMAQLLTDPAFRASIEDIVRRERSEVERQIGRRLRDESAPQTTPVAAGFSARARRMGPLDGGGDFYDVLVDDRDPDALVVACGTVSGQGIAASIAAAGTRHALQGVVYAGSGDLVERLGRLRDLLTKTLHPGTAISVVLARVVASGKIRVAATGGAGALVYRSARREIEIARGVARRDDQASRLDAFEITLLAEDRVLLASDGAGSLRAPVTAEPMSEARLSQVFRDGASLPPSEAVGKIMDALVAHGSGSADRDATVVYLSRT